MFKKKPEGPVTFVFDKKMVYEIARIIEKTKLEQFEVLQLEGFPENNYIYCIDPATPDPNSFDVGT